MQPGYLRDLLPHSAPDQPESLQSIFDGEVSRYHMNIKPQNEFVNFFLKFFIL